MKRQNQTISKEHLASAKANDLHISTKHSVEICSRLRYKTTNLAKKILEDVINLKKPIPFKRFKKDVGHKPGMAAGRFPQKAAREMLRLIKTTETNAQFKGLNTSNLKISKILANKASIPMTGGRGRGATKRTNLEIEVIEAKEKKKTKEKTEKKEAPIERKVIPKVEEKKETQPEIKEKKEEEVKKVEETPTPSEPVGEKLPEDNTLSEPTGEQEK